MPPAEDLHALPAGLPGDAALGSAVLLDRMTALHPARIDLSLDRMWRLLDDLGAPQDRLPPVVHVAGTNGKGSTTAMLRAGLAAAGLRVHVYTSPHLVRFHERIRLAGAEVSEPALADLLARTLAANADRPVTFFEASTAAALLGFAETPADVLLLEVGMGGRLDSTNVVARPALCVITPVDMDHQAWLGTTRAAIAAEKAGILKRGVPAVIARQQEDALAVIEARAARLGAPLAIHGQHWHVGQERGRCVFQDEAGLLDLAPPCLVGPHQIDNAGTVLAALRALEGRLTDAAGTPFRATEAVCEAALTRADWPARMQRLASGPIPALAPRAEIWLDGGHNPHAAQAMAATLRARGTQGGVRPLHLVMGMQGPRDPRAVLAPFAALAESVTAVPVPGEAGSHPTADLAEAARRCGLWAQEAGSVEGALRLIDDASPDARVLIFGSLYLAGHVLRAQEAVGPAPRSPRRDGPAPGAPDP